MVGSLKNKALSKKRGTPLKTGLNKKDRNPLSKAFKRVGIPFEKLSTKMIGIHVKGLGEKDRKS